MAWCSPVQPAEITGQGACPAGQSGPPHRLCPQTPAAESPQSPALQMWSPHSVLIRAFCSPVDNSPVDNSPVSVCLQRGGLSLCEAARLCCHQVPHHLRRSPVLSQVCPRLPSLRNQAHAVCPLRDKSFEPINLASSGPAAFSGSWVPLCDSRGLPLTGVTEGQPGPGRGLPRLLLSWDAQTGRLSQLSGRLRWKRIATPMRLSGSRCVSEDSQCSRDESGLRSGCSSRGLEISQGSSQLLVAPDAGS